MDETLVDLFYGAVLHDVGKIVQRADQQRVRHSKLGTDFLKGFQANQAVLHQVSFHHYQELSQAKISVDDLAYITYIADNIASGADRRDNTESVEKPWDSKTNLEDVFNKFGENSTKRYFEPSELDLSTDKIFAESNKKEFTSGQYAKILQRIKETLSVTSFTEEYIQSTLNLLEATASFIPSSTNMKEVVDISLYDHMKMTAGFAASIYLYLQEQQRTDFKEELFKYTKQFYEEKAFLLTSFDLSGIQDFIYTITSSGAHKQLRSRSFYLDMISEWIVDSLLKNCGLTRANLMYSGGGHAYLILPNTAAAKENIVKAEQLFNDFFLSHFSTSLYVAFGCTPFSAKEIMQGNTPQIYRSIFQRVSQEISNKKINRYTPATLLHLNRGGKRTGRECAVCHTVDRLVEGENKCHLCYSLEQFSKDIQRDSFFEVSSETNGLPIGPDAYLHKLSAKQIKAHDFSGEIYAKNQFHTGVNQATHLWVADYAGIESNEFSLYAQRKWTRNEHGIVKGIKRLAVMRCDVDDLGYAFMAGFSHQEKGMYNTFARTAAFSRSISLFFKLYINTFAEQKKLTIVYAGGDDVFILGAWDDVLQFSVEFRQYFIRWTNGKLTLSTGIGFFPDKTPINVMARLTGELEEAAKENGKDSICLFSESNTFSYDVFIKEVYNNKLHVIRSFFNQEEERGKAFIYKLLDLIRERDEKDHISFARLAYYLARLEAVSKNKANFKTFKQAMKEWYEDAEQIRQAEMALILYVYETRKEG